MCLVFYLNEFLKVYVSVRFFFWYIISFQCKKCNYLAVIEGGGGGESSLRSPISLQPEKLCPSPLPLGWSGGAMVLGLTSSAGASFNLDYSRARAYCACSRCGWGLFGYFYSQLSFLFSFSLSLGDGPI